MQDDRPVEVTRLAILCSTTATWRAYESVFGAVAVSTSYFLRVNGMKFVLRNFLIAASISFPLHASAACKVPYTTTDSAKQIFEAHGGFPVSEAQCNLLNQKNLKLNIDGDAAVLNGVNVGWAIVRLVNSIGVPSETEGRSTYVNNGLASQNIANDQFYMALKAAIGSLDWQKAAGQVTSKAD
jgi:hypothetical protein